MKIKGMGCGHCANAMESIISKCAGILGCDVSFKDGKAVVEVQGHINKVEIEEAVGGAGFLIDE